MLLGLQSTLYAAAQAPFSSHNQFFASGNDLASPGNAQTVFTPKVMLEVPHLRTPVVNPEGTLAAFFTSQVSLDTDSTLHSLQVISLDSSMNSSSIMLEVPSAGDAFWYDESTLILGVPNYTTRTTDLYAHYVSIALNQRAVGSEPGEYVGTLPTESAVNFRFSRAAQALVFSDKVYPDGDLTKVSENDRAWSERKNTALAYDGSTYPRLLDTYTGPKRSSLFSVRLSVDGDGKWRLANEYANILNGTGHHTPVEGQLRGRKNFDVKDLLVAYTTKDTSLPEPYHSKQNVYLVDIFGRTPPRELTSGEHGATLSPTFSPDGQKVVWLEKPTDGNDAEKNYIVMHDLAKNTNTTLLKEWDRSPSALTFSPDGAYLYIAASDTARIKIFVYPLPTSTSGTVSPTPVTHEGVSSNLQSLPDGRLLYTRQTTANPGDLFLLENLPNANGAHERQLTNLARNSLKSVEMPEESEFWFKGAEGRDVHGVVVKPVGWTHATNKNRTWPVVLYIHGGPEFFSGSMWSTLSHPYVFTHHGYFYVSINPTGSTSFGRNFTNAVRGDWGGAPLEDLRKGFKRALKLHPEINPDRAVALGWSYGGYMINWLQTNQDKDFNFKALTSFAGVLDLRSYAYATDTAYMANYEWKGKPWEKDVLRKFAEQSPSNFVHKWATPELVVHGDLDFRTPVTEGLATFSALQQRGVPSRLLIFREEGHIVRRPHNLLVYYDEMLRWFDQFVGANSTSF